MAAEISICHKRISAKTACNDVLQAILEAKALPPGGVRCIATTSMAKHGALEHGCALRFTPTNAAVRDVDAVWSAVKKKFPFLTCAHVHVHGSFQGCIFDFVRASACPVFRVK